jgi:XapX domain-containing protein
MRDYGISLLVGLLVGVMYGLIRFRSPAPPAIALIGLLGMLAGEQLVPMIRTHLFAPRSAGAGSEPAPPSQKSSP